MAISYNVRPLTDGLVYYLDAANPRCYAGTGNTAFDLKGSAVSTLVNGTGFSSTQNGYFSFDGTNDYIDCGNFLDNPTDFTIIAWQKTSATTNIQMIVAKLVNYSSGAGWAMWTQSPTYGLAVVVQTNASNWKVYYSAKFTNDGFWHHCAAVITNKIVTGFYVDGVSYSISVTSGGTISTISNAVNVRIGRDEANEYIFQGNISQAQLYNRALSAVEIRQLYNATKGRYGL